MVRVIILIKILHILLDQAMKKQQNVKAFQEQADLTRALMKHREETQQGSPEQTE